MHQLIPYADRVIGQNTVPVVDGKDLHRFLEIRNHYSDWIKDQIERGQFIENRDFIIYRNNPRNSGPGRPANEYYLTFDTVKHIGMMSQSTKGIEVREYFIACEKELRETKYPDEPVNSTMDIIKRMHDEQGLIIQEVDRNKQIVASHSQELTSHSQELTRLDASKLDKYEFDRHLLKQQSKEAQRQWYAKRRFPDWVKEWMRAHAGGRCLNPACRRQLNPDPRAPRAERPQYDHVLSIEDGGMGTVDNCQLLCAECNQKKSGLYVDYRPKDLKEQAYHIAEERAEACPRRGEAPASARFWLRPLAPRNGAGVVLYTIPLRVKRAFDTATRL